MVHSDNVNEMDVVGPNNRGLPRGGETCNGIDGDDDDGWLWAPPSADQNDNNLDGLWVPKLRPEVGV